MLLCIDNHPLLLQSAQAGPSGYPVLYSLKTLQVARVRASMKADATIKNNMDITYDNIFSSSFVGLSLSRFIFQISRSTLKIIRKQRVRECLPLPRQGQEWSRAFPLGSRGLDLMTAIKVGDMNKASNSTGQ